jgi:hypothetical protein
VSGYLKEDITYRSTTAPFTSWDVLPSVEFIAKQKIPVASKILGIIPRGASFSNGDKCIWQRYRLTSKDQNI